MQYENRFNFLATNCLFKEQVKVNWQHIPGCPPGGIPVKDDYREGKKLEQIRDIYR